MCSVQRNNGKSLRFSSRASAATFSCFRRCSIFSNRSWFRGHLYARNMYGKERKSYKCYIVLFSCASTPAIHLELTPDLQETSFLRALKRFIGRRGIPSRILSDNGKTFVDNTVQNYVHSKGIVWKINIPKASWWGGLFESMVKLTKRCLRKTTKLHHVLLCRACYTRS